MKKYMFTKDELIAAVGKPMQKKTDLGKSRHFNPDQGMTTAEWETAIEKWKLEGALEERGKWVRKIKKISKESLYQHYGWFDLEDDLDKLLKYGDRNSK